MAAVRTPELWMHLNVLRSTTKYVFLSPNTSPHSMSWTRSWFEFCETFEQATPRLVSQFCIWKPVFSQKPGHCTFTLDLHFSSRLLQNTDFLKSEELETVTKTGSFIATDINYFVDVLVDHLDYKDYDAQYINDLIFKFIEKSPFKRLVKYVFFLLAATSQQNKKKIKICCLCGTSLAGPVEDHIFCACQNPTGGSILPSLSTLVWQQDLFSVLVLFGCFWPSILFIDWFFWSFQIAK